ncbi:MAG: hypothetical protein H0V49_09410 [Nocardioidaceae bacterium]|nr:hypothetical protein [Nocardioidaceae bacterium]
MDFSVPIRSLSPGKQCLLVVAVLFGVLFMHGVATGHAVHMPPAESMSGHSDAVERLEPAVGPDSLSSDIELAALPGHPLVVVCMAVVVAGLTLPLLGHFRVKKRARNLTLPAKPWHRRGPRATTAAWVLTPSLTRLCISRT